MSFVGGNTRVVGVFGFPVEHSLSPAMHNAAFAAIQLSYIYVPFAVRPEAIGPAIRSLAPLGIVGVNLTIPHKQSVLPFIDEITPEAREVGAVNTVHCVEGRLLGDNTDGRGFFEPLREMGVTVAGERSVVLGAGGAARSVVFRLVREGSSVTLVNRTTERAERLAADVAHALPGSPPVACLSIDASEALREALSQSMLLVQTTRVGMYPEQDAAPLVTPGSLHPGLLVYDLVYNPVETRLLKLARDRGCRTLTGVKMLVYQGAAAFERWTGVWPPTDTMEQAVLAGLESRS
jgi:shikimate dehydrogenase